MQKRYAILDLLLLRVRVECESGHYLRALAYFRSVLFKSNTAADSATSEPEMLLSEVLSPRVACLAYLSYILSRLVVY